MTPEPRARQNIDQLLTEAGWTIQDREQMNLGASQGVAVREFQMASGAADYLLFIDRKAAGVIEAKPEGTTLGGVSEQTERYLTGIPSNLPQTGNLGEVDCTGAHPAAPTQRLADVEQRWPAKLPD